MLIYKCLEIYLWSPWIVLLYHCFEIDETTDLHDILLEVEIAR